MHRVPTTIAAISAKEVLGTKFMSNKNVCTLIYLNCVLKLEIY